MPKKIYRYTLDSEIAVKYFQLQLQDGNSLSQKLLENLDFKKGNFFTLLPSDANFKRLYDFSLGGILLQNEIQEVLNDFGKKSYFSWTPTLKIEISRLIFEKMKNKRELVSVFEDILRSPPASDHFFKLYGMHYFKEIYYCLNYNASEEDLVTGINRSNAIWHQVFVVTKQGNDIGSEKSVTLNDIKSFSLNTQLLFVGAYDGEGYVVWEADEHA